MEKINKIKKFHVEFDCIKKEPNENSKTENKTCKTGK